MIDVLRSRTRHPGAPYRSLNESNSPEEPPVELVFCNPDLLWRGAFERPRLGQGAFVEAFQAVYKVWKLVCEWHHVDKVSVQSLTGNIYPYTQYGKPYEATYRFAETMLTERIAALQGSRIPEAKMPLPRV